MGRVSAITALSDKLLDVMYTIQACEQAGIKTVFLTCEHGGKDGRDSPLQFYVPEAVAMVAAGSLDAPIELPRMPRVVGGATIRARPEIGGVRFPAEGPLSMEWMLELYAANNEGGWGYQARLDY